jgi:hypothetical protein
VRFITSGRRQKAIGSSGMIAGSLPAALMRERIQSITATDGHAIPRGIGFGNMA